MKISEKVDAEYINDAVFRQSDRIKKDTVFYKCGLLILSVKDSEIEKKLCNIDRVTGLVDKYIIKNEMKRALLYAALLRKKVSELIEEVNKAEINLPASN